MHVLLTSRSKKKRFGGEERDTNVIEMWFSVGTPGLCCLIGLEQECGLGVG